MIYRSEELTIDNITIIYVTDILVFRMHILYIILEVIPLVEIGKMTSQNYLLLRDLRYIIFYRIGYIKMNEVIDSNDNC